MTRPTSRTIPALLDEQATRFGELEALVGGDVRLTYAELRRRVRSFAKGLTAMGVRKGDRIAILMGNHPEWIIADLAICSLGCVMISINTWVSERELAYILSHSDADTLIYADRFLNYDYVAKLRAIEPLSQSAPLLARFIHKGTVGYTGSVPFDQVYELGAAVADEEIDAAGRAIDPSDIAYLLYTSGSTSTPKGVQLQHFALIENMWNLGNRMHAVPGDRAWLAVSLYWGLGCENILFNMLTHGGCVVLQEHFEPGEALRLIEAERCTLFYGSSNMSRAMWEHPDRPGRDLSSLRSGGASGTVAQMQRLANLGPREVCHSYGLTESYGNCNLSDGRLDPREKVFASVGRPLEGFTQRVVDPETMAPKMPGEVGEIQMKGYVTIGYYKDPEKNREAFTADGFFRTGDLGFIDEDGYLYFRGRLKEMIKTGGLNVSPAEVESILMQQDGVKLAYVIAVPDEERSEIVGAILVTDEGLDTHALLPSIEKAMKKELAAYKRPRVYRFIRESELPLTGTGKLHKKRFVEFFQDGPGQRAGSST